VCLNPKDIPPDDLDDVILGRMIKKAEMFYKMELEREKGPPPQSPNPRSWQGNRDLSK